MSRHWPWAPGDKAGRGQGGSAPELFVLLCRTKARSRQLNTWCPQLRRPHGFVWGFEGWEQGRTGGWMQVGATRLSPKGGHPGGWLGDKRR